MKNMLIAATAVGATIAALILYIERRNRTNTRALDANDNYRMIDKGIGSVERPAYHAMG